MIVKSGQIDMPVDEGKSLHQARKEAGITNDARIATLHGAWLSVTVINLTDLPADDLDRMKYVHRSGKKFQSMRKVRTGESHYGWRRAEHMQSLGSLIATDCSGNAAVRHLCAATIWRVL